MSRARAANSALSFLLSVLACFTSLDFLGPFFCSTSPKAFFRPDRVSARPSRTDAVKAAHLRAREGLAFTVSSTVASLRCRVETVSTRVSFRHLRNSDNGATSTKRRSLIYAATITTRMGRDHRSASIDEREGLGRTALQSCDKSVARPEGGREPPKSCMSCTPYFQRRRPLPGARFFTRSDCPPQDGLRREDASEVTHAVRHQFLRLGPATIATRSICPSSRQGRLPLTRKLYRGSSGDSLIGRWPLELGAVPPNGVGAFHSDPSHMAGSFVNENRLWCASK